jgi:hypothetical protein
MNELYRNIYFVVLNGNIWTFYLDNNLEHFFVTFIYVNFKISDHTFDNTDELKGNFSTL